MAMNKLLEQVHHTVSVLTGARTRECCPECGSENWYKHVKFSQRVKEFSDNFEIAGYLDFDYALWSCDDCDYDKD